MTASDVLTELESLGSEQTRKILRRHGATDPLFGVSYANFGKLCKRIKVDHELARGLWASGIYDARILAAMVADPAALTNAEAEAWAKDLDNHPLADQYAGLVARGPLARAKADKWTKAKNEWVATAGWGVLARLAGTSPDLPDDYFAGYLAVIERDIHSAPNRVRYAMNNAIIGIGCRNDALKAKALAAAARVGKVEVDHGETSCQTPDAAAYIAKVYARRKA